MDSKQLYKKEVVEFTASFSFMKEGEYMKIQRIILHHSATDSGTFESIKRYHVEQRKFNDIGYQYLITQDGVLHKGRSENTVGAHTLGQNDKSLGIALVGNFDKYLPNTEQLKTLNELLKDIFKRYGTLPIEGHNKYANKSCPGKLFPMVEVIANALKEDTFELALQKCMGKIMNSPDYWKANAVEGGQCKGEYVRQLIINMADKL